MRRPAHSCSPSRRSIPRSVRLRRATQALQIVVQPSGLAVTTATLPDGAVGAAYSSIVEAAGGVTPYAWAISAGALPDGLALNASTGEITGTPTTYENASFTVQVTDSSAIPQAATRPLSILVNPAPLAITTGALAGGQVGVAYSDTMSAAGGAMPYAWQVIGGALPAGLALDASTGVVSGVPTAYETANFTVEVSDSQSTPATDTQALSITIAPAVLVITTASLPDGQMGVAYSQALAAVGGATPYAWSIAGGALPDGLVLNAGTGAIEGTPSAYGTFNFTAEVADSQGTPATDTQALSITIAPATLAITTATLPDGQVGVAYDQTVAGSGGVAPYTWSVLAGALPSGLSLNASTGAISGTPTAFGTASFTVQAADSQGTPATDTQALSITVAPAVLAITTTTLADAQVGVAYSETLAATGGVPPCTWTVSAGSLPDGLSLNASTGEIGGTPTTTGTSNFTVEAADSQGTPATDTQALSITVQAAGLLITTGTLPDGQVGVAYSQTLAATGGVAPYAWSVSGGALPGGLSLNASTGEISGTPAAYGTFNFTAEVADSQGTPATDTQALSITIAPETLAIATTTLPDGQVGAAYSEALAATGGIAPYAWSVSGGALPGGLALNASTGEISGTPTAYGTFNFTAEVADAQSTPATDTQALSITIAPAPLAIATATLPDGQVGIAYSQVVAATGGMTPYGWSVTGGVSAGRPVAQRLHRRGQRHSDDVWRFQLHRRG